MVTRIDVSYRREVFLCEVTIKTELATLKQYTAEFRQSLFIAGVDEPAVTGCIHVSFLNRESRRPMRLRDLDVF